MLWFILKLFFVSFSLPGGHNGHHVGAGDTLRKEEGWGEGACKTCFTSQCPLILFWQKLQAVTSQPESVFPVISERLVPILISRHEPFLRFFSSCSALQGISSSQHQITRWTL